MLMKYLPEIPIDSSGESTRLIRVGLLFGVLLFGVFFIWGMTAPIQGAVIAGGTVKIDLNRKSIQHLEGGIIKQIYVREGSWVKEGEELLDLEDIATSSQFNILQDRYLVALAKQARLLAQKKRRHKIVFPDELLTNPSKKMQKILDNEIELFNSNRKSYLDQLHLLNMEIEQSKAEIAGLAAEMSAIRDGMSYIQKQLDANHKLKKKGYVLAQLINYT